MQCTYEYSDLGSDDWEALRQDIDPKGRSSLLDGLLEAFRRAGAVVLLEESAYIDRDFSAAYAAFYSTLYRQRAKHCRRIHFFASDLERVWAAADPAQVAATLQEDGRDSYLGYIVVRPLAHAPVSHALLSSRHGLPANAEVAVRSSYAVHVLGAELEVEGVPLTEQDTLTGSCAQATIWAAGRHLHNRHSMAWFSVIDITEAAIKPTDSALAKALPVGSESLNADNIVRALRAMGEHPVVYQPEHDTWNVAPSKTIAQYLDSGIPVIVGLRRGDRLGHAVVAVGTVTGGVAPQNAGADKHVDGAEPGVGTSQSGAEAERPGLNEVEPAPSDLCTHILVNDDQRGPYQLLPVRAPGDPDGSRAEEPGDGAGSDEHGEAAAQSKAGQGGDEDDGVDENPVDYSLNDAIFLIVPLPNKVFLKAEVAEAIARDKVEYIFEHRDTVLRIALNKKRNAGTWDVDPEFHGRDATTLVARTYLTSGWKYKQRIMRNTASPIVLEEVSSMQLPRYVWVTEFSLPEDVAHLDPCSRRVRGHVLIDATGNKFDDGAVLLAHVPGLLMGEEFDSDRRNDAEATKLRIIPNDRNYLPKVRGWRDFEQCAAPPTHSTSA